MLHVIRLCWTVSVLAVIFAGVSFLLNGTGSGARLCLHSALGAQAGPNWAEWFDYDGPSSSGEGYVATLQPLQARLDDEAPSGWSPKLREWWGAARQPTDTLTVNMKYGDVWFGANPGGFPDHSFGLAFGVSPTNVAVGSGVLVLILLGLAFALGKHLDSESKQQQFHRPGSAIDRHAPRRV